jgi:pyruvate/2-oxoglutarate dehydrogenase complex dihydrolipoamide acyltransferase (E2) component
MSTNEEQTPLGAAPEDPSPRNGELPAEPSVDPAETLSPAVRRLVRQFDLDITGIHGTGPSGRIRVGDVMGLLNGRTDSGNRDAPARPAAADSDADLDTGHAVGAEAGGALPAATAHVPTSTVFDCDVGRVLAHRKKLRLEGIELLTTSYFLTALAAALDAAPEITAGHAPRFGVLLTTPDGGLRSALLDVAAVSWDSSLDERVRAVDAALRANLDVDVSAANLLVHHYGESGSLLATPTPIGAGHVASVGIGRLRREIAVRATDGVETPRVATRCYLSLSFFEHNVPLHHANRALAAATDVLERWP